MDFIVRIPLLGKRRADAVKGLLTTLDKVSWMIQAKQRKELPQQLLTEQEGNYLIGVDEERLMRGWISKKGEIK